MNTPITVGETPIVAIGRNTNRYKVFFKNIGNKNVYFTRQTGTVANVPSATNYNFVLGKDEEIEIKSIAQYNAVTIQGNEDKDKPPGQKSQITIMETVYVK